MSRAADVLQLWPLLTVRDIEASILFWTETLGFAVIRQAEDDGRRFWCQLERGGASIMLQVDSEAPTPSRMLGPVTFYFVVDDARFMHEELVGRGLDVPAPQEAYYGMLQLPVPTPDGYEIVFESPTEKWTS